MASWRSGARLAARALGWTVAAIVALLVVAVAAMDTRGVRRLAVSEVNRALAPQFQGQIRIDALGHLSLFGVRGVDVTILDPHGRPVVVGKELGARVATWTVLRSLLFGRGPLEIDVTDVSAESIEAHLDEDASGQLGVAAAFAPKEPSAPPANGRPGRGLRLVFGHIAVAHVTARGHVVAPPLDARIDDFVGAFTMAPEAMEADVAHAQVTAHELPGGVDLGGVLNAHLRAPSAPGAIPDARASWRGVVANVTSALDASLQGGMVDAVLDAPQVSPEAIRAFWAGSPFDQPGRLHVDAKGPLSRVVVAVRAAVGDASVAADGWVAPQGSLRGQATLDAHVPQGRAHATFDVGPEGKARALRFTFDARVAELDRIPRLPDVHGSAALTARGSMDLDATTLDADTEATVDRLAVGPNRVGGASLDAHAHGPLGALGVDAVLHARSIVLGGRRIAWLDASTEGSLEGAAVRLSAEGPDIPRLSAGAAVKLGPGVALRGLHAAFSRGPDAVVVTVRSATLDGDDVQVDDARIDGAGGPASATFAMKGDAIRVRALSEGLDLGALARIAGLASSVSSGTLAFDVDADLRRDLPKGRVAVRVEHGSFGTARNVSAGVELALDGRQVKGRIHAEADDVGVVDIATSKLVLPGEGPLSAVSWRKAWGDVTVEGHADLTKLAVLVPPERSPFAQAAGTVQLKGHFARTDAGDTTPDVQLSATTNGLYLVPRVAAEQDIDGVWVVPYPPWHLTGIDFDVDAHVDGATGRVDLSTTARDPRGAFAHLDADFPQFPWPDALHAPARLATDLRTTPFEVHLHAPKRGLSTLPAMVRQDFLSGSVEGDLRASGTMLAPKAQLSASIHDSVFGPSVRPIAVDFELTGSYDGRRASADLKARADGQEVLSSNVQAVLDAAALLGGAAAAPPWTASAKAHLQGLPLKAITALDDKMIAGTVTGDVTLDGLHEDGRARADLTVDKLHVGTVAYQSARATLDVDGKRVGGTLRVDQGDGFLDAKVEGDASWGAALAPALGEDRPLRAELGSKNFRIAALLPFVDGVLDELDGRLDADAHVELEAGKRQARLSGDLTLSRGAIEASAGGGEFHDISAEVTLAPDGSFAVKKMSAAGITGRLEAKGSGKLAGTHLENAKLEVTIPKNAAVPVSAGGAEIGSVDGKVDVSLVSANGGALAVQVSVPSLRVTLPQASGGDVQSLGAMTDVRIGAHRGTPATFVLLPAPKVDAPASDGGGALGVAVQIGDVEVVRGTDLNVDLDGKVDVAGAKVSGQIRLKRGGVLVIQGRTFTVDSGTVTFVGADASNPQVVVRAGYKAADGTVVYATFTGPLKTGKVTLSSEPSLPQQEIVELLMFGTTGGPQAQGPTPDAASSVVGTVGGEAAEPLNHALNQIGLGAVRADVDTTSSANPRPEIEIQLARDISLKVAVVLGQVPPGVNPDHTLLTVAWRFLSRWSLASTLGDAGTTIFDLLWQRRY